MNKRKNKKSGSGASNELPTCSYFNQLLFLADSIGSRSTVSNVTPSNLDLPLSPPQSPPFVPNLPTRQGISTSHTLTSAFTNTTPSQVTPNPVKFNTNTFEHSQYASMEPINPVKTTLNAMSVYPTSTVTTKRREKRKDTSTVDMLLAQSLIDDMKKQEAPPVQQVPVIKPENKSADALFCRGLIPYLNKIQGTKKIKAKIKIMEVLLDFNDENKS